MSGTRKPALLYLLSALILLESAGVAFATIYLVVEIFVAPKADIGTAIAFAVVVAIGAVALGLLARAALNARPWIRGATVCVAVLQLLVAYSILVANAAVLAIVLAVPAIALLVLIFTPPVLRATVRPTSDAEDDRTF